MAVDAVAGAGPPLPHIRPFLPGPGSSGSGGGLATGAASPVVLLPAGWCSRLQLPVHRVTLRLPPPLAPPAGHDGSDGATGAETSQGPGTGSARMRVVCAAVGRGLVGQLKVLAELLGSADDAGSGSRSNSRSSNGGRGAAASATPPPEMPLVFSGDAAAVVIAPALGLPTASPALQLCIDGAPLPVPRVPGAPVLLEVHPRALSTIVQPPLPPSKQKRGPGRSASAALN
jgi:hypothetical protein